jgi:hypothetical protein
MTSLVGLLSLMPGVAIVRLRFEGRLRGGVGGLMKRGDGGAELFLSVLARGAWAAGGCARRLVSEVAVLMPRFFRLRAFFAGVVGRCSSKKLDVVVTPSAVSGRRARKSAAKEWFVILGMGDSGEGPGEGSVTEDESIVEIVVVGELSDEAVEFESRLSWWLWKEEKGAACIVFCVTLLPCAVVGSRSGRRERAGGCESAPKTAPNEGMGVYVLDVVVAGMLGGCVGGAVLSQRLSSQR